MRQYTKARGEPRGLLFSLFFDYNTKMNWALRRRLIYLSFIFVLLLGGAVYFAYPYFTKPATCTDNKMNGTETGVDCGGQCRAFCTDEVNPLVVVWARTFPVSGSLYSAVAYIENQNINAGISQISYQFKVYDGNNVLITTREGKTFVAPNGRTAIFEPGLNMGNRVPRRTAFSFTTAEYFYKMDARYQNVRVFAKDPVVGDEEAMPKVEGVIENNSIYTIPEMSVIAIVYDEFGNALGASKTITEALPPESRTSVFFSWLAPFGAPVRKVELLPLVNPFTLRYE